MCSLRISVGLESVYTASILGTHPMSLIYGLPIKQAHDVVLTSMRRHDVAST